MNITESGIIVTSTGMCIFLLGVLVMLDKALMIVGNLIIVVGMAMLLRAKAFSLLEIDRLIGTVMFAMGIFSLLFRYTLLGFLLEIVGFLYIFKKSIPSFKSVIIRLFYNKLLKMV